MSFGSGLRVTGLASLILAVAAGVAGAAPREPGASRFPVRTPRTVERVACAVVDERDALTRTHVTATLQEALIDATLEGSQVLVPAREARRAAALLRRDAREYQYSLTLANGETLVPQPRRDWKRQIVNRAYAKASAVTGLPPVLAAALKAPETRDAATTAPFVREIRFAERRFLEAPRRNAVGYDVAVDLGAAPTSRVASAVIRYQVWHDGQEIRFQGVDGLQPPSAGKAESTTPRPQPN